MCGIGLHVVGEWGMEWFRIFLSENKCTYEGYKAERVFPSNTFNKDSQ